MEKQNNLTQSMRNFQELPQ